MIYRYDMAALSMVACGVACGVMACGEASKAVDADGTADTRAFIVAGDYTSGMGLASTIAIPSLEVIRNVIAGVASDDPVLRLHDGRLYIVNRFGHDNITILDAASLSLIEQISTGPGTNPQDVAVRGETLYVAALAAPGILVIENGSVSGTIDLASLDPDGVPDCSSVYLVDELLFVTCGLLRDFAPVGPGKVVVIDTSTSTVLTTFDLVNANPVGFLRQMPVTGALAGDLLISTVLFGEDLTTGCLERIGVGPAPASRGCLIENAALGGYATGYAYGPDDTIYVAVTTGFDIDGTVARVMTYDVETGMLGATAITPEEQRVFDLTRCPDGEWIFADARGGIRVYDADGQELTQDVLDIGLPPTGHGMVCYRFEQ